MTEPSAMPENRAAFGHAQPAHKNATIVDDGRLRPHQGLSQEGIDVPVVGAGRPYNCPSTFNQRGSRSGGRPLAVNPAAFMRRSSPSPAIVDQDGPPDAATKAATLGLEFKPKSCSRRMASGNVRIASRANQTQLCDLQWLRSRTPPARLAPEKTIRIVDLFCGCGGFSLGVSEACRRAGLGFEVAYALDADEDSVRVFQKNFVPNRIDCVRIERVFQGQARLRLNNGERVLAAEVGPVDLLVAGPPCQGHSDLNNHSRRTDHRNALYARVARVAQVLRPAVVVIENVPGVIHDKGKVTSRASRRLEAAGYAVKTITIDARALGIPQARRRHFLIAFDSGSKELWRDFRLPSSRQYSVGSVLAGLEDEPNHSGDLFRTPSSPKSGNRERIRFLFEKRLFELPDRLRPDCHKDGNHTYKAVYGRLRWDGIANTITSGFGSMGQGRFVHPLRPRMITPHEAARIQGFPDWFDFSAVSSRVSLQTMIGNAVIPKVAAVLANHLFSCSLLDVGASSNQHDVGTPRAAGSAS